MLWQIFEIVINIYQAILMITFLDYQLNIPRRPNIYRLLAIGFISFLMTIYSFFDVPISDTIVLVVPCIYALTVSKKQWYLSVFWTVILALLFFSTISLSLHVFTSYMNMPYEELMRSSEQRFLFILITNCALTLIVILMAKFSRNYMTPHWPALMLFLLILAVLFFIEESVYQLQLAMTYADWGRFSPFLGIYIGLLLCTVLVILLFHMMARGMERENRFQAEIKSTEQLQHYHAEMERMYIKLVQAEHDMKQHYQLLQEMVTSGSSADSVSYLSAYQTTLEYEEMFQTGSTSVDALLMAKTLTMKNHQILFRFSAYPLDTLPINEPDFCSILGNLLDNAIEGTLRVSDQSISKVIQLTLSRSWDMFYLYCTNICNEETIQKDHSRWLSSKTAEGHPGLHAIGIQSIERIVTEAEGRCSFTAVNGHFHVKIVLPYTNSIRSEPNETKNRRK